jgi:hypothetical protein
MSCRRRWFHAQLKSRTNTRNTPYNLASTGATRRFALCQSCSCRLKSLDKRLD